MSFAQSLWCIRGSDNKTRFLSIQLSLYIGFIFLHALSPSQHVFHFILLALVASFSTFSIIRRLNDANLINSKPHKKWMPVTIALFVLCGIAASTIEQSWAYGLFALPAIGIALLFSYMSHKAKKYTLGYHGPVDLSQYINVPSSHRRRIEPSLVGVSNHDISTEPSYAEETVEAHSSHDNKTGSNTDEQENVIQTLLAKPKRVLVVVASIMITGILLFSLSGQNAIEHSDTKTDAQTSENSQPNIIAIERLHPIDFPDSFSLMVNQHSGIYIHWQADETSQNTLWSQQTTLGDKSCSKIVFNNKKSIRSLNVVVEQANNYYAYFSPLDTKVLLKQIADRSHFKLCGYEFSLKGSQSALERNSPYNELLN